MTSAPYNPLDKINLALSIERAVLDCEVSPLDQASGIVGAGVYVIYYIGQLDIYESLSRENSDGCFSKPVYIGKAIPKGGRKGGLSLDAAVGNALSERLSQHAQSIREVDNLNINDFFFRSLVIEDIWIPLGENILIENFKPVWNKVVDGFGNKDPGRRRATQRLSPWDIVHPGREFAKKLAPNPKHTPDSIKQKISEFLLPK